MIMRSRGFLPAAFAMVRNDHITIIKGKNIPGRNLVSKMLLGRIPLGARVSMRFWWLLGLDSLHQISDGV